MTSTRLSTSIRERIQARVIQRAFKVRAQELFNDCSAYAHKVYEEAFAKDLKRINDLPEGWLPTENNFKVTFGGEMTQLYFWGTLNDYGMGNNFKLSGVNTLDNSHRRFPCKTRNSAIAVFDGRHPLSIEFDALKARKRDLGNLIHDAGIKAMAAMNKCSTVKRLIQVWPEIEPIARDYQKDGEQKAILPAIPRERLNAMLDLPPAEEEVEHVQ